MIPKVYYSELGKLLYAVADIDGMITKEEKKALQDIVKKELSPFEDKTDEYGTDAAWYAEMEFDFLEEEIADAKTAYQSFIDFVEDHHKSFDRQMKKVCLHITKEIAAAYRGTNKKEKIMIDNLKKKLEKIVNQKKETGRKKPN